MNRSSANKPRPARPAPAGLLVLLFGVILSAQAVQEQGGAKRPAQAPGTRRMSERLEKIGKSLEAVRLSYTGVADPGMLRYFWQIRQPLEFRGELVVGARAGCGLLDHGRSRAAEQRWAQVTN